MGIKVTMDDVKQGLANQNKLAIFPGYREDYENYVGIEPKSGDCSNDVSVTYDTNFAVSATDASTLTELIDLTKGVIPLVTTTPTINTVINGVAMLNQSINKAVDSEKASGSQEFKFMATPCPEEPKRIQCYEVMLHVIGKAIITDADRTDEEEKAELTLTLSAKNRTASKTFTHPKQSASPIPIITTLKVNVNADSPFSVYAKLDEYCETDGPGFIGRDSASVIRIDFVKITITTLICEEEEDEKKEEESKSKKSGATDKSETPIIGEKALKKLRKDIKAKKQ